MKKLLLIILCFILVSIPATVYGADSLKNVISEEETAIAESGAKDPAELQAVFENEPTYEYDKFAKSWTYYTGATRTFTDAFVVVGINTTFEGEVLPPQLYVFITDVEAKGARQYLYLVNKISFLLDDVIYSFPLVDGGGEGYTFVVEEYKDFLKALKEADLSTIAMKLEGESLDMIIESDEFDEGSLEELQYAAGLMYDADVWSYVTDKELSELVVKKVPMEVIE